MVHAHQTTDNCSKFEKGHGATDVDENRHDLLSSPLRRCVLENWSMGSKDYEQTLTEDESDFNEFQGEEWGVQDGWVGDVETGREDRI